jgi:hypothetical protein
MHTGTRTGARTTRRSPAAKARDAWRVLDSGVGSDCVWSLELDVDFDAAQAPLEVSKHFMSTIRGLINSTSKLCRVDGRVAKGTFSILSLEPVDSFLDQLATF